MSNSFQRRKFRESDQNRLSSFERFSRSCSSDASFKFWKSWRSPIDNFYSNYLKHSNYSETFRERQQVEYRDVPQAPFELVRIRQEAGAFPDPPLPGLLLYCLHSGCSVVDFDLGAGRQIVKGQRGAFFVAPAETACYYETDGPVTLLVASLPLSKLSSLVSDNATALFSDLAPLHEGHFSDPFLFAYTDRLWAEAAQAGPLRNMMFDGALSTIIATLLHLALSKRQPLESPVLSKGQLSKIMMHLENHLDETISVKRLAGLVELSEFHFSRAFKATLGDSPYRYLLRRRLEVAKHLLLSTKMSLAEVALEVGFSSQAHFTSTFKRLLGFTPGEVKKG
jgi:AraC family transcriptional regulator